MNNIDILKTNDNDIIYRLFSDDNLISIIHKTNDKIIIFDNKFEMYCKTNTGDKINELKISSIYNKSSFIIISDVIDIQDDCISFIYKDEESKIKFKDIIIDIVVSNDNKIDIY